MAQTICDVNIQGFIGCTVVTCIDAEISIREANIECETFPIGHCLHPIRIQTRLSGPANTISTVGGCVTVKVLTEGTCAYPCGQSFNLPDLSRWVTVEVDLETCISHNGKCHVKYILGGGWLTPC